MASGTWLLFGMLATVLWGTSYGALKPAGDVSPFVTNTLVGIALVTSGVIGLAVATDGQGAAFRASWRALAEPAAQSAPGTRGLYVLAYVVTGVVAGYCYLYASQIPGQSISILTSLTSVYPLVTTLIGFAAFAEWRTVRLQMAVPGLGLAVVACILLALSPLPASASRPIPDPPAQVVVMAP